MASTRIFNDKVRVEKQLQEMTDQGRYTMNVPGNGLLVPFIDDPHVRLDKWGANYAINYIEIDSNLKNLGRNLNPDYLQYNQYRQIKPDEPKYPDKSFNIDTPYISEPKWNLRSIENERTFNVIDDNHKNIYRIPFNHSLGTRNFEKDLYCKK